MALFVEVVNAKGFRRAAQTIGMPNSTLSRRIAELERAIGLRLLQRTTRRIELTDAGQIYYERCKRIVDEARLAHEQLGGMLVQPTGVLRASFPVDFAIFQLAPLMVEFARRYPDISFEFDLSPQRIDMIAEHVDVAIRMGESPSSRLIARKLALLPRFLYASPQYVEAFGEPAQPADLTQHECLRLRTPGGNDTWTLYRADEREEVAVNGRFLLNSVGMIRRLATLDFGIAVLVENFAANDVAKGRLRRVLPQWQVPPIPVYAITETRLLPAKTQYFIEFLREQLGPLP